jgi:phage tail protein X
VTAALSHALNARRRTGGAAVVPLLSSVQADGWQGVWAGGTPPTFNPNGSPVFQTFTRQGYDASGSLISFSEQIPILRRVRNPFPNQATDTASNVALGDYILSTDSAAGVTNSSTEISPKPIGNWVMRDRRLVGNSIDWEIIAFHYYARSNRQVAAVRVRANDGTTQTAWQVVSSTAISTFCEDANPVEVYRGTLDITGLAAGMGWLEAEVMPWVGASASVLRSEDSTVPREFSRRYFLKNVTRVASPPLAYVASAGASPAGNDTTGVWSTTAATAAANPFLTVAGAMNAMNDAVRGTPATGGIMDGCRIRIVDTVDIGSSPATARAQNVASLIIERAPGTARSAAIVTWGNSFRPRLGIGTLTSPLNEGAITFFDVTLNRTGSFTFIGEAPPNLMVNMHNVTFSSSIAGSMQSSSHLYMFGCVITGTPPTLSWASGQQKRMLRGITVDVASTQIESWIIAGSNITRPQGTTEEDTSKPRIAYSNKWFNPSSTSGVTAWVGSVSGGDIGPVAWVQNLIEATHTTGTTAGFRLANDTPAFGNVVHAVVHHNTNTGFDGVNRNNFLYDEAPVARFHKFMSHVGDMPPQLNTKGDIFAANGARLGQFAYTHGVGCRGNFSQFAPASVASESQTFPGIGSKIGTSQTVRQNPLFTNYQGTGTETGPTGPTTGAGGGTYTLTGGSPARGILAKPVLGFDLAGNARPSSNDAAGAYA